MTEVRGYRDVAVAALLDLLDALGLDTVPELGPVGTFVPAVERLAADRPVVFIVDGFDLAGPSTRRVLMEAATREHIALLAGFREHFTGDKRAGFDATIEVTTLAPDRNARRAVLRRRLAGLSPEIRETLAIVAVAGDGVGAQALRELRVTAGLAGAFARNVLCSTPDGAVAFVDPELRALVIADMPAGIRDERHHALGHVLAGLGAVEDAARHLVAAAEIEPGAAVRTARAAATAATASGAHHDAAAWLSQARDCCRDARTEIAITIELGDALRLAGDPAHVDPAPTGRRAGPPPRRRRAARRSGVRAPATRRHDRQHGVDPTIDELLERALRQLKDKRQIALVRGAASLAFSMTGAAERSRSLFLAAERGADDPLTRRRVLPFAYMATGSPRDLDRRRGHADELLALAAEHEDPVAAFEGLHLAASVQLQDAHGEALRRTHRAMSALVDRVGDVGRRWALHYLAAAIAHLDGDGARVEALSSAAFAQFAPVSESRATAVLFGQLCGLRLSQGRVSELRPVLETLVDGQPGVPAWNAALALGTVEEDPRAPWPSPSARSISRNRT